MTNNVKHKMRIFQKEMKEIGVITSHLNSGSSSVIPTILIVISMLKNQLSITFNMTKCVFSFKGWARLSSVGLACCII